MSRVNWHSIHEQRLSVVRIDGLQPTASAAAAAAAAFCSAAFAFSAFAAAACSTGCARLAKSALAASATSLADPDFGFSSGNSNGAVAVTAAASAAGRVAAEEYTGYESSSHTAADGDGTLLADTAWRFRADGIFSPMPAVYQHLRKHQTVSQCMRTGGCGYGTIFDDDCRALAWTGRRA